MILVIISDEDMLIKLAKIDVTELILRNIEAAIPNREE